DAPENLIYFQQTARDLRAPVVTGEVGQVHTLSADIDEGGGEEGDQGAGREELLSRLLQATTLQHAHLHADFGPVLGCAGGGDEVVEAVVVDIGGEAVEGLEHSQQHADRLRPAVDVAAGVELGLGQHGLGRGHEVRDHPAEAFGHGAGGF